jgi:hypothetical protein
MGDPLRQVRVMEGVPREQQMGKILVSHEAWNVLKPFCSGRELEHGVIVESIKEEFKLQPIPLTLPTRMDPRMHDALKAYLPEPVLPKLMNGQLRWMVKIQQIIFEINRTVALMINNL